MVEMRRRGLLQAVAGFGLGSASLSDAIRPAFAANGDTFRVGWVRPSTGIIASSFAPLFVGGLIAVEEINAAGGIFGRKIVRVEEDDEGSPAKEPAVTKKLNGDGIDYFVGPGGSSQALASLAFTTPAHIIQTTYAAVSAAGDGKKYPYHYQYVFNTDMEADYGAHYIVEKMKIRKIGILQENTAYGDQVTTAAKRVLKSLGVEPVATEVFPLTAPDLGGYVSNLKKAGSEGLLFFTAAVPQAAMAYNAMHNQGWYPPILGHLTTMTSSLFDLAPLDKFGDQLYAISYKALSWEGEGKPGERQIAFAKKMASYAEAKGNEPVVACAPYYDFLYTLKQAIEGTRSFDTATVKQALDGLTNYEGLLGPINFTASNHCGVGMDQLTTVKLKSYKDPRALGIFRERV